MITPSLTQRLAMLEKQLVEQKRKLLEKVSKLVFFGQINLKKIDKKDRRTRERNCIIETE